MSKIATFNRTNLKDIRQSLVNALKQVENEYGITIEVGSIGFSNYELTAKFTGKTTEGIVSEKGQEKQALLSHGLAIGMKFQHDSKIFEIVGWNDRARRSPVKLKDQNGKSFKASVEQVTRSI